VLDKAGGEAILPIAAPGILLREICNGLARPLGKRVLLGIGPAHECQRFDIPDRAQFRLETLCFFNEAQPRIAS
jgi:hypothetical protein